jgi:hypothetical protein
MKRYLLVFDDGHGDEINLRAFVDSLDDQAQMYTLDGHVGFIQTNLPVADISSRFLKFAGSSLFFVADITNSDYSGRMPGSFWDYFKKASLSSAAV